MTRKWLFPGFLALIVPSIVALSLHGYLGSFNRFMADDFCSAFIAERFGVLRAIWYWYRTWSGGFSTSIMDELLAIIKPSGMPFVVTFVLIIWVVITYITFTFSLSKSLKHFEKFWISISLSFVTVFTTLLLSPDIPQSLYWWVGMRAYTMPLIVITGYVAIFQWFRSRTWNARSIVIWSGISFGIIFVNSGFSEIYTPVQVIAFILATALILLNGKANFKDQSSSFVFAGLLGAITGLIVMLASPGNAIRQSYFPETPSTFSILRISLTGYSAFLLDIVSANEKIVGLIGVTLGAIWIGMQFKMVEKPRLWSALAFLAVGFVFAFGCFPPGAYGLSEPPPGRTHIIADFMLIIGFLVFGLITGTWLEKRVNTNYKKILNRGLIILIAGCMGYASFLNSAALFSLRGEYAEYAQKWDVAEGILLQASRTNAETVYIPALKNWARVFDPSDNSKFYVNVCIAEYYRVDKVIAIDNFPTSNP